MLTYREISEILKMVDASECEEFVLELEGVKLVIRRAAGTGANPLSASSAATSPVTVTSPAAVTTPSVSAQGTVQTISTAAENEGSVPHKNSIELRSPMVGTFYRRPSPDKSMFVKEGDRVEPGTPLCLIEVMKLYTTIESTTSGTISGILAEDGQLVEFDQLLFLFNPITA